MEMHINVSKFTAEQVIIDLKVRKNVANVKTKISENSQPPETVEKSESFQSTENLEPSETVENSESFQTDENLEPSRISENSESFQTVENSELDHISEHLQTSRKVTNSPIQNGQFSKIDDFCQDFKTQFTFDEDLACTSETELQKSSAGKGKLKATSSDVENRSWIVDTRNAKKARRKKKARDKKLFTYGENNRTEPPKMTANSEDVSSFEAIGVASKFERYSSAVSSVFGF